MIKNLLNKYVSFVDSTGWKTFFKVYLLAVLYFLVMCFFRTDEFGFCIFIFPFNPLDAFIAPLMKILELCNLTIVDRIEDPLISLYTLLLTAILINLYRLGKKDSTFRQRTLILSQTIKIGLMTYFMIVVLFYIYLWVSGQDCSFRSCGFLKGYY